MIDTVRLRDNGIKVIGEYKTKSVSFPGPFCPVQAAFFPLQNHGFVTLVTRAPVTFYMSTTKLYLPSAVSHLSHKSYNFKQQRHLERYIL